MLVAVLEAVSRAGLVSERYLPPFSTVVVATIGLFDDGNFLTDLLSTVLTWAIALSLSILVAVPIGMLLGLSDVTYRASRTVIELVRTMPAVALIPLVILVAGQGLGMKLIIAVYAAMWPILFNALYGVHGTDPAAKEMARSFGLGPFAIVRRVVIPSAAPLIATGVRVSSSIVIIVIITVELIAGGTEGLGAFIMRQQLLGDQQALVYAGILVTGLLGLAINTTLGAVERRMFRWNSTART
ncbi:MULTISPECIES: ABC transporter permease [unclassified Modestobacter]